MQLIGTVQFVQIQRSHMKTFIDEKNRVYHPAPLLHVEKLLLTVDGIMGIHVGESLIDVHHAQHPTSRFRGDNKISIGFTQSYDAMRQRFGEHMTDGIAGENIIVQAEGAEMPELAGKRIFIKNGADKLIELRQVIAAPPCKEFSIFCSQQEIGGEELKTTLQWLDHGRRGFYAELVESGASVYVQAGDQLFFGS